MKAQCRVTIKINHEEHHIEAEDQVSILQLATDHKIKINSSCGGFGTCGACRIFVENNVENLPPKEGVELDMAEDRGFAANERLSCQIVPFDGLVIRVPSSPS